MLQTKPSPNVALEEASQWFAKMVSGHLSNQEKMRWESWKQASHENNEAWQQIEALNHQFASVDSKIGLATLKQANQSRRHFLKQLTVVAGVGLVSAYAYREQHFQMLLADYSTNVGQIKPLILEDGTRVYLNTDSAIDVVYNAQARLVKLLKGEVLIDTGHDQLNRKFSVETPQGVIIALGTRFNVRELNETTEVSLFEGKLKVQPSKENAQEVVIEAGQSLIFGQQALQQKPVKYTEDAWVNGLIVVYEMPLSAFIQVISRYKNGWIKCNPNVANLKISGTFSITNPDASLHTLEKSLPVKVQHYTRYFTSIEPV